MGLICLILMIIVIVIGSIVNAIVYGIAMAVDCKGLPTYENVKRNCIKEEYREDFSRWEYVKLFLLV